ncbi:MULTISPECIES: NAD(P)/FAD-dependent oxidoreductase [Roseobacteraceae]|uniref:Gamma-glutamylputrescine oxidoreductase n=1 Tax=Pseudosulfitobacter pseudonitzschiae TaxID=1402135 RepID=A0A221K5R2_9RHOB|nr:MULTISPECIES: FAD-binding oxidoreductase [Roseobacteraceae]ASM74348.1 gamma-glutamylputrescine oxidoreductase [Pseudosulfitobacter pseudonitzschiae]
MLNAPSYHSPSGWNALLSPRIPRTDLPMKRRYKTIVIGAGITGLAAAHRLAELSNGDPILVLEASTVGEGATSRNSGYLLVNPGEPSANATDFSRDWAQRQMGMAQAGIDWLKTSAERHAIDCSWDETSPTVTVAASPRVEAGARQTHEAYRALGMHQAEYNRTSLSQLAGTDYYSYGFQSLTRALVQPAALHRGLADALPSNVTLLEQSPVTEITGLGPFEVRTSKCAFVAEQIFITNNLHARAMGLNIGRMVGIFTYAALTPELPADELSKLGEAQSWGLLPAHRIGTTLRKVGRRLLIRSGDSYEREQSSSHVRALLATFYSNRFPQMRSHEFQHVWGGVTSITRNGGYHFGQFKPGIYVSAGCGGAGLARGAIHGRLLAELASGQTSQLLKDRLGMKRPTWLPPEPLRSVGAQIEIAIAKLQGGRER